MIKYIHFSKCRAKNATPVVAPLCRWEPGVTVRQYFTNLRSDFVSNANPRSESRRMHSSQSVRQSRPLTSVSHSWKACNSHQICSFYLRKGFYGWWHLSGSNAPSFLSDVTPRILTRDSQEYPVVLGVDVIMNCSAFSSPPPTISW